MNCPKSCCKVKCCEKEKNCESDCTELINGMGETILDQEETIEIYKKIIKEFVKVI